MLSIADYLELPLARHWVDRSEASPVNYRFTNTAPCTFSLAPANDRLLVATRNSLKQLSEDRVMYDRNNCAATVLVRGEGVLQNEVFSRAISIVNDVIERVAPDADCATDHAIA